VSKPGQPPTGLPIYNTRQNFTDLAFAVFACLLGAAITYVVLSPSVGFDDANITLNYAENIARGLGYVYVQGGERVEGSTSALWTAINVIGYLLFERPEPFLSATGLAISVAIVFVGIRMSRLLLRLAGLESRLAAPITASLFIAFPAFFGWTIWSLMDIGLWILLVQALVFTGLKIILIHNTGGLVPVRVGIAFGAFAALATITRPEGVVLGVGVSLLLLAIANRLAAPRFLLIPLVGLISSLTAFAGLTLLRLWYFGAPFPNTYYAKVSTELLPQMLQGLRYTLNYLLTYDNLLLLALAALAVLRLARLPGSSNEFRGLAASAIFIALTIVGATGVYVLLGGDHFGSFRFYQMFFPLLAAVATIPLVMAGQRTPGRVSAGVLMLIGLSFIALQWTVFARQQGNYGAELRIAEGGREIGTRLNQLSGDPSIGIVIAGGVAMTYDGPIYDLLGLNWVEMARTQRDFRDKPPNHGGFAKPVFYKYLPDIVTPDLLDCAAEDFAGNPFITSAFIDNILSGLFRDTEFNRLYTLDCWNGLSFFRKNSFVIAPGDR